MMTTNDEEALLKFAKDLVDAKKWRDVGQVIERAKAIDAGKAFSKIWQAYEKAAQRDGTRLLKKIDANKDNKWVDKYLDWEEQFALTSKSDETIEAFQSLRTEHEETAKKLYNEGRKAFQNNHRNGGYAKHQEIVDKYYASTYYRTLKATLDKRR